MIKPVTGYMTSQGRFFETQREADLSETYHQLSDALDHDSFEYSSDFFYACKKFPNLVRNYIMALQAMLPNETEVHTNGEDTSGEAARQSNSNSENEEFDNSEPISSMDIGEYIP